MVQRRADANSRVGAPRPSNGLIPCPVMFFLSTANTLALRAAREPHYSAADESVILASFRASSNLMHDHFAFALATCPPKPAARVARGIIAGCVAVLLGFGLGPAFARDFRAA